MIAWVIFRRFLTKAMCIAKPSQALRRESAAAIFLLEPLGCRNKLQRKHLECISILPRGPAPHIRSTQRITTIIHCMAPQSESYVTILPEPDSPLQLLASMQPLLGHIGRGLVDCLVWRKATFPEQEGQLPPKLVISQALDDAQDPGHYQS